ncbi:5-formyltetrahydrofolate cyclo-ligase, partial [Filobasidium floriforme]
MESVFSLKKALRKATTATLKQLDQAQVQRQSQAVREMIHKKGLLKNIRGVSCYLSMENGELSTSGIVEDILSASKYLANRPSGADRHTPPAPENDMRMLRLYTRQDFEGCPRDKWGIPDAGRVRLDRQEGMEEVRRQDAEDVGAEPLDMILVPGVAFDRGCGRVGHGKGYYDRYIQRY